MNLLAIIIYSRTGDKRIVDFHPGELNIVTGFSKTGKSALLDIVEFCLGRDTFAMPVGPITDTVSWYAVLVQLPTTRAFVARPAPDPGRASTQRAMLELGADLQPLNFDDLTANADSSIVREQIGRLIGIGENQTEPDPGSLRSPFEAHLGHALWLCLQRQGEIGNRDLLFHRQGEQGIAQAIRDTLPYFLGAVPSDQARRRLQLQVARRDLRRMEAELATAERLNQDVEVEVRSLLTEAYTKGLTNTESIDGRDAIIAALSEILAASTLPTDPEDVAPGADRIRELQGRRDQLRRDLRDVAEQQTLLTDQANGERQYQVAARVGASRLEALNLAGAADEEDSETCPICGSVLDEPDPTVGQMQLSLDELRRQLNDVETARPRRGAALAELEARADGIRQELRTIESTLTSLRAADAVLSGYQEISQAQAFTKGRIDLYLTKIRRASDDDVLAGLRGRIDKARHMVERLEADLDPDDAREQLTSRLLAISEDMTRWAQVLRLEHAGRNMRLDLSRLTVITDTEAGPAPLFRIGSAENWVASHLVTHLALHRYFVRQGRPVPHLLILDQPTQAFYPSEVEQRDGVAARDDDRAAVSRMFELMHDVATELAPQLQIIVCDHANLPQQWYQDAVRHNWRGQALIPADWMDASAR